MDRLTSLTVFAGFSVNVDLYVLDDNLLKSGRIIHPEWIIGGDDGPAYQSDGVCAGGG